MCGIAGVTGAPDDALPALLEQSLHHRGPDGGGVFWSPDGDVALVARRLAILDLALGEQPFLRANGELAIVFNGEIYNSPELRADLERGGMSFASDHSDTEVVLALYERDGIAMLQRLNGMFAFVIYDARRKRLVGARDRLGIKPLYLAQPGGHFAFASELRTLLQVPGVRRDLDLESLGNYLSLRFVPGERSILEGVRRLPPGHAFTYDLTQRTLEIERWWHLSFAPDAAPRDEWIARLRAALKAAVTRWNLSDVPVACSLSGGLDSSAVAALLAHAGGTVKTYSLGFTAPEDSHLDELPLARGLAERYGTDHHELVVEADKLLADLPAMVWSLDEPYGGGLPSWYVFRFMSDDVKVGHTGTGGDELFGNYRRFVPFEQARLARFRKHSVRRYLFEPSYYLSDRATREIMLRPPAHTTSGLLQHAYDDAGSASSRDSVLHVDLTTQLPDEFLHMTDRFSMAHSLEARTPLLDHELVELVATIPPELRTSLTEPKGLLRDAVADLLTPEHLQAPKRGFVFPLARWLRGPLRPVAERLLGDEHIRQQGIFRPVLARRFLNPHLDGSADHSELLWGLLMFQLWHLIYVEHGLLAPPSAALEELVA